MEFKKEIEKWNLIKGIIKFNRLCIINYFLNLLIGINKIIGFIKYVVCDSIVVGIICWNS